MGKGTLKDKLEGKIPDSLISEINKSFEIVGDIAIIEIPEELTKYDKVIADTLLEGNPNLKTVLKKTGEREETFRNAKLKFLAGEDKKETVYTENGIKMEVNVETVYFSSKLGTERLELMKSLKKYKKLFVMFSGTGPYTLNAIKSEPNLARVLSVEINPEGHKFAISNLDKNKTLFRKSDIYNELLLFLRVNKIKINDRDILTKVANLRSVMLEGDVREINYKIPRIQRPMKYDNTMFNIDEKECYENLQKEKRKELSIDLEKTNIVKFIPYFVLFSDKFNFTLTYKGESVLVRDNYARSVMLNFMECIADIHRKDKTLNEIELYDEIYMPLPKDATNFLDLAFKLADNGCIIHVYDFSKEEDFPHITEEKVNVMAKQANRKIKILKTRKVGQSSPRKFRICCDIEVLN